MKKPVFTPLMIFGVIWVIVILVSWWAIPNWQKTPGGFWLLAGLAAPGALAFLTALLGLIKTYREVTLEEKKAETTVTLPGQKSTQAALMLKMRRARGRVTSRPAGTMLSIIMRLQKRTSPRQLPCSD